MRFNFKVEYQVLERKGKLLFPKTKTKHIHVYADSEEEALKKIKKGYMLLNNGLIYEYNDKLYLNASDLDNAIEEAHEDEAINNCDPHDYIDYDSIMAYDVTELDCDDFEVFKRWCVQENKQPSHYASVEEYFKELKR